MYTRSLGAVWGWDKRQDSPFCLSCPCRISMFLYLYSCRNGFLIFVEFNGISYTIFRLIWNQMKFCLFANQSENSKHYIIQFYQYKVGSYRVGWGFIRWELTYCLLEGLLATPHRSRVIGFKLQNIFLNRIWCITLHI